MNPSKMIVCEKKKDVLKIKAMEYEQEAERKGRVFRYFFLWTCHEVVAFMVCQTVVVQRYVFA